MSRILPPGEAHKLEQPERLTWLPPREVLASLQLHPGMNVADIGAGTGYFAVPIAREIAPGGKLFAIDLQAEMLHRFRQKLLMPDAPTNIELIEANASSTGLVTGCCNLVLMANIWHEFEDRRAALNEAMRLLERGGRLVILDWRADAEHPPGPPREHRIATADAIREIEANGWRLLHSGNVGLYSYELIATSAA